uniref:protein FAM83G isoform X2 n=1 Tax=Semicossyphus pulcher TaxID=241346 RepID=UPI0037E7984E
MALSQIQCLDHNHVNPRTHESKPEFLYCEDQRLALEALLQDGREGFFKCLEARGLRGFLSDPELETLTGAVEPYDPGLDLFPEKAEDDEPPLSLHYWPDLSDTSIPHMDIGWPDTEAYRGVTRTTVYSQPPLDGQAHIKEVVRKMIAQAQKVIAVVMDVFTDVDIFRDLLDAGFKRRVSVYILLERTTLPHFLSMCQRANMHGGHLKHLRVRCADGAEFYSRSSTKVRGQMGHRFMFIDGDRTVSGSYSFTWMSSRLDKNLITVVTGQAVDAFDKLYRTLYSTSTSVDLRQVATDPEPEPEPIPQPVPAAVPSAALARKMHNPKYALVTFANPSPSPSAGNNSPQANQTPENSKSPEETSKRRRSRLSKEALQEGPPLHPGLVDLEKACLITYLPTWPEPDPPKDVIGFINVRDARKPTQVHLQRSEMFETSQAIRFSSPFNAPKEILPEVATPRQFSCKPAEMNKLQPAQNKTKAEESQVDGASLSAHPGDIKRKAGAGEQSSPASGPKCDATKTLNAESRLGANTPINREAGHNTTPHLNAHTLPQSSTKASTPNPGRPTHTPQTVTTSSPKPDSPAGSNTKRETETSAKGNSTQTSHTNSNKEQHTQTQKVLPHTHSHAQAVHTQPQNSSEITLNVKTPTANGHVSSSSASTLSENNNVNASSSVPPLTSSSATLNLPLPSPSQASALPPTSAPPVPKPRTIQLLIKDGISSDGKKLLECSAVVKPNTSTGATVVQNESAVVTMVQTLPEKQPEIVPELWNNSRTQKDTESTVNLKEAPQQKQSGTSQETKNEEAVGLHDDRIVPEAPPNVSITEPSKAESVNIQERIPSNDKPKTLTSKLTAQIDGINTVQTEAKALERAPTDREFAKAPNENSKTATHGKTNLEKAPELKRISDSALAPQNKDVLEAVDTKHDTQRTPNARESKHTPEKSLCLPLSDTHTQDLRSLTPDKESCTPTPDGLPLRTPTPDSRMHTPDPRSYTPDLRTPTPDGYMSAFEDSNLSTTSEEFYECSVSPCLLEPFCDRAANINHWTTEDHVAVTTRLTKEGASTGDPKPKTVCSEGTDKEKATLGPSVVIRKDKPQATREAEGQKYSVQRTPVA